MRRQSSVALCLISAASLLLSSATVAEDRRRIIPANVEVDAIRFEGSPQTVQGFLAKYPEGDFVERFKEAGEARVSVALRDLNGDDKQEVIAFVAGPITCGARDCQVLILTPTGSGYRTVFDGFASSVALGARARNGWRDVITNLTTDRDNVRSGVTWTWTGERYEMR